MEPVIVVLLVGLIGGGIGYIFTRLNHRSVRVRLKNDIKLLEIAPAGSAARASLGALVDREAERLNRQWAGAGYRLLPQGCKALVAGVILYLVAYGARSIAFQYFSSLMTIYISAGDGSGYQSTAAVNWIQGTTAGLQTLGIAVGLLGITAIACAGILRLWHKMRPRLIARHPAWSKIPTSSSLPRRDPVAASAPVRADHDTN